MNHPLTISEESIAPPYIAVAYTCYVNGCQGKVSFTNLNLNRKESVTCSGCNRIVTAEAVKDGQPNRFDRAERKR